MRQPRHRGSTFDDYRHARFRSESERQPPKFDPLLSAICDLTYRSKTLLDNTVSKREQLIGDSEAERLGGL